MTEEELMDLLSDVQDGYIKDAQLFRTGKLRPAQKERRGRRTLPLLATAAVLALILGLSYRSIQGNLKSTAAVEKSSAMDATMAATLATEGETAPKQTYRPDLPELEDWARAVLENEKTFESKTYGKELTLEEYTQEYSRLVSARSCKAILATQLDLDGDGGQELLIRFARDGATGELTLLLGLEDGKIISQELWSREVNFLNKDGSYWEYQPGSGDEQTWVRLHRENGGWVTEPLPDHPDYPSEGMEIMDWYDLDKPLDDQ